MGLSAKAVLAAAVSFFLGSNASNAAIRKRALVLGIDGASGYLVDQRARQDAQAPGLLRLMQRGVFAPCASITDPSCARTHAGPRYKTGYRWVTGPGWAAVLSGADAEHHRVKGNGHNNLKAFYKASQRYPTFLKALRDRGFGTAAAGVGSFITAYDGEAVYHGVLDYECGYNTKGPVVAIEAQQSCNLDQRRAFQSDAPDRDAQLKDWLLQQIDAGSADVLMGVFDQVDAAGHAHGYSDNASYMAALSSTDKYIRELASLIEHRAHAENEQWLVVITSDHGGHVEEGSEGGGHDTVYDADEVIPFILSIVAASPQPLSPLRYPVTQMDVKPTLLQWFGVDPQEGDGQVQGLH